jgi:hypothetical protein
LLARRATTKSLAAYNNLEATSHSFSEVGVGVLEAVVSEGLVRSGIDEIFGGCDLIIA